MQLNALDLGDGPAVLLLHGQPGRAAHWSAVAAVLGRQMRVIVPDRPGYGRSPGPAGGFQHNAEEAVELLDRKGVGSAVVAGHSWGGGVALALASRFPDRVAGMVLIGSVAPRARPRPIDHVFAHPRLGPAATRLLFSVGASALSLPPMRRLGRVLAPQFPPAELPAMAAEWRHGGPWRSFHAEERALVDELPSLAGELGKVRAPTIVLVGRRDLVCPPSYSRDLVDALPRATLVMVGGGHLLPQLRPQLVAEIIASAEPAADPPGLFDHSG
jgi:pimeloyl-ACP methyl ester carboxylesterase